MGDQLVKINNDPIGGMDVRRAQVHLMAAPSTQPFLNPGRVFVRRSPPPLPLVTFVPDAQDMLRGLPGTTVMISMWHTASARERADEGILINAVVVREQFVYSEQALA